MNKESVYFFLSLTALALAYFGINSYYVSQQRQQINQTEKIATASPTALPTASARALATTAASSPTTAGAGAATPAQTVAPKPPSAEDLQIENAALRLHVTEAGGCVRSVQFKDYQSGIKSTERVELFNSYFPCKAYGFKLGSTDARKSNAVVRKSSPRSLQISQVIDGVALNRTFTLNESGYAGTFVLSVHNTTAAPATTIVALELGSSSEYKEAGGGVLSSQAMEFREVAYLEQGEKVVRELFPFKDSPEPKNLLTASVPHLEWIGTGNLYFLGALLPKEKQPFLVTVASTGFNVQKNTQSPPDQTVYETWLGQNVELAPGATKTSEFELYLGPKSNDKLSAFASKELQNSIDYGFFRIVAWPMFHALNAINSVVHNWGIAIVLLTLCINLLFFPLNVKAYLAGKKMQKLQPELTAIREKYKDDKQKQQQETMAVMSKQGANPISGCLPILPQIPVFFGLNSVLTHTFELRQAPFFAWIQDLSARDPMYISPLIMAVLMYMQQRITPMPSVDPTQQKILRLMPIIFAVFMLAYPSGLVLYIITNAVFSLVRQKFFLRKYADV